MIKKMILLMVLLGSARVYAHGQMPTEAVLEVQPDGQVRMRARIPLVRLLWRTQASNAVLPDFLTRYAGLDDAAWNAVYLRLQDEFSVQAHLVVNGAMQVRFFEWHWPEASAVRSSLRMILPVALGDLEMQEIIFDMFEIQAKAKAYRKIDGLELKLPSEVDSIVPAIERVAAPLPVGKSHPAKSTKAKKP